MEAAISVLINLTWKINLKIGSQQSCDALYKVAKI